MNICCMWHHWSVHVNTHLSFRGINFLSQKVHQLLDFLLVVLSLSFYLLHNQQTSFLHCQSTNTTPERLHPAPKPLVNKRYNHLIFCYLANSLLLMDDRFLSAPLNHLQRYLYNKIVQLAWEFPVQYWGQGSYHRRILWFRLPLFY